MRTLGVAGAVLDAYPEGEEVRVNEERIAGAQRSLRLATTGDDCE